MHRCSKRLKMTAAMVGLLAVAFLTAVFLMVFMFGSKENPGTSDHVDLFVYAVATLGLCILYHFS